MNDADMKTDRDLDPAPVLTYVSYVTMPILVPTQLTNNTHIKMASKLNDSHIWCLK